MTNKTLIISGASLIGIVVLVGILMFLSTFTMSEELGNIIVGITFLSSLVLGGIFLIVYGACVDD